MFKKSNIITIVLSIIVSVSCSTNAFWSSTYSYAADVTFNQDNIALYRADVAVYPKGKSKTKIITKLSEEKPEALVKKILQINEEQGGKGKMLYVYIQLELKTGRIFDMKEIKLGTHKAKAIRNALADKLFVECDYVKHNTFFDTVCRILDYPHYNTMVSHSYTVRKTYAV